MNKYLAPTETFDWDSSAVREKARELTTGLQRPEQKASVLFFFVRDKIIYRIFSNFPRLEDFKASVTLEKGYGFCIPKAILLASLGRAVDIPTRVHFMNIRNHQLSRKLREKLETDLLTYHGYVEFLLGDRWVKANPAFDMDTCERHDIIPVDFSGREDALFHKYDRKGRLHIEYVADHGTFADLPYEQVMSDFRRTYRNWK